MCLIVGIFKNYNTAKGRKPRIASKDIEAFKWLIPYQKLGGLTTYYSPFMEKRYSLNKKYSIPKFGRIYTSSFIQTGFILGIQEGLHSYIIQPPIKNNVFKAIIPKGSLYLLSEDKKEIVSNQLIIKKKIN